MVIKTKAIVLTSIKYGEADLIVKCLTEHGVKSYLLRSIFRSKSKKLKIGYFQALSQLEITAYHNKQGNLNKMSEASVNYLYQTLATDIYKQSIALFLAEVLAYALKEEEENQLQFQYIEASLKWLDLHSSFANFHLIFLLYFVSGFCQFVFLLFHLFLVRKISKTVLSVVKFTVQTLAQLHRRYNGTLKVFDLNFNLISILNNHVVPYFCVCVCHALFDCRVVACHK